MKPWVRWTASVVLAAAAVMVLACSREAAGPEAKPLAKPALWRVADADTTVYLFGSLHMLPPGASWRSDPVDRALAESSTVYFEADVVGDPAGMAGLVERLGRLPPPQTLSRQLSPDQSLALGAVAARLGLSRSALDTMQPWYAAVVISDAAIRAAGYGSADGVDTQLRQAATGAGKQLRFLETVEQQLSALAGLPADVQLAYLG
ncbi:MAG: TraB/GumN family protein, partial [Hyphomonadaceae bacterium]